MKINSCTIHDSVSDAKIDVVGSDCYGDSLMGEVVRTSGPYLYPCSVQYSLIAASMYKNNISFDK